MSKKERRTVQSTETRTPNNPTWVTQGLEGVGGALQGLMGRDPTTFIAGPSALQSQAFGSAGKLGLSSLYGDAEGIFKDVAGRGANTYQAAQGKATGYDTSGYDAVNAGSQGYTASSLLEGLDRYKSPYEQDVVNTALADFDFGAGATRANQALEEARSGAFGGSGAAITRALTESDLARGRAATSANLRDQMFTRATGLSATDAGFRNQAAQFEAAAANQAALANAAAENQAAAFRAQAANQAAADRAAAENQFGIANMNALNDAGRFNATAEEAALARQLQAGGALASLGQTMGADERASIALQGALGADMQAIDQARAQAPLSVLQQIAATYGGMPLNLLSGATTTGNSTTTSKTSDPMSVIGTLGSLALAPVTGGGSLAGLAMNALKGAGSGYSDPALSGAPGFLNRFMR